MLWGWPQPVNNSPLLTLVDAYAHLQVLKPHFKRFKGFFNLQLGRPSLIAVVTLHGGYVGIGTRIKLAFGPSSRFFFQKRGQVYSPATGTPATPARLSHGRQRTGCHPPSMSHFGDLQATRISSCPQLMCPSGDRCQNEPMYHFIGQDLTKPRLNRESTACKSINMS